MKRLFDIFFALLGLLFLLPLFLLISILILLTSSGGVFYFQTRVGLNGKDFKLYKFRTMRTGADKQGLLTVGADARITKIGKWLRKYKLDELPQLINVLNGTMSLVGPRPEVRKYVELYSEEQKRVLSVKPGITDYASIEYSNENHLLGLSKDPENTYINEIMPVKLNYALKYIDEQSLLTDVKLIFRTILKVLR